MKTPSVKTLSRIFDNPKRAKDIFLMSRAQLREGPAAARFAECRNPPKTYDLRLFALNACGDFHGCESLETDRGEYAEYLNSGDTYAETVIYWRGNYRVQSVGDFVETMERQGVHFK